MFTGIINDQGTLASRETRGGGLRLAVDAPAELAARLSPGGSVAVNGVCLTLAAREGDRLLFDVSAETVSRTRLAELDTGAQLNLEPALTASDPIGGHFVTGHVDGVGEVVHIGRDGQSRRIEIQAPESLARYIAEKGSITVDGISLTVNEVKGPRFGVNIVPHTWSATNLRSCENGARVHLEADIIARYLARLVSERDSTPDENDITTDYLSRQGFTPPVSESEEEEYEDWQEARGDGPDDNTDRE